MERVMKVAETQPRVYSDVITINVDVQNDFALPDGALSVRDGEKVIEPLNQINEWTRANNGQVVFTRDYHPLNTRHFAKHGGPWPVHCVAGTSGAEIHKDLRVSTGDIIANKGMGTEDDGYSGWYATTDEGLSVGSLVSRRAFEYRKAVAERGGTLKEERPIAVLIGGLATDYCVKATCLDAYRDSVSAYKDADFIIDIYLLRDAVRAVNLQDGDELRALDAIYAARVQAISVRDVIAGGITIDHHRLEV